MPLYAVADPHGEDFHPVEFLQDVPLRMGPHDLRFSLFTAALPGTDLPVYFVACPALYGRPSIYAQDGDEHVRFAFLSRAVLESCQRMGWRPDVLHANDWHTALLPVYLRSIYGWDRLFARTRTVLTIHNIAYQGVFPADVLGVLGLDGSASLLHQDHLHQGYVGFLETGILHANAVTAVSKTYARQIQTPSHGMGLDGLLRARSESVVGIVNGVDYAVWSPERDRYIAHRYSATELEGKARNREVLLRRFDLDADPSVPVVGIVSRLTPQKGFDLCGPVLGPLLAENRIRLVALGSGLPRYAEMFATLAAAFPGRAAFHEGKDDQLAHWIEAGADVFLMPSLFEPCGLNQMYSLRYGTVPVVHRTGGLADTVRPFDADSGEGTGFVFEHFTTTGLAWAMDRALETWAHPEAWRTLQQNGMREDFSWEKQILRYVELYGLLGR
jgi:starch synthase